MIHLYAGFLGLHTLLFSVSPFTTPLLVLAQDERPKSALEWITVDEARKLPNGFLNDNLLRDGLLNLGMKEVYPNSPFWPTNMGAELQSGYMFCRAKKEGCMYPGQASYSSDYNNNGIPYCRIITKEKVYSNITSFQLLYNPNGAAQVTWLPWKEGTGNLNFPSEVVKSSEYQSCNFMLGRYIDTVVSLPTLSSMYLLHSPQSDSTFFKQISIPAMVDSDGFVYYEHRFIYKEDIHFDFFKSTPSIHISRAWAWDNNEYDLLIERTAQEIELIELNYGDPERTKGEVKGQGSHSQTTLVNEDYDNEKTLSTTLESTYESSKSWSHSVEFGVSFNTNVEVSTPGKDVVGGASASFGFERSFGYNHGWGSGESHTHTVTHTAEEKVPPRSRVKVKMTIMQTIENVPYKAKYKVTYDDGETKIINDEGVMTNSFIADNFVVSSDSESID